MTVADQACGDLFDLRGEHDPAFADNSRLLEQMLEALRSRPNGASPAGAMSDHSFLCLPAVTTESKISRATTGWWTTEWTCARPLRRTWEQYENELTDLLIAVRSEQSQPCYGVG